MGRKRKPKHLKRQPCTVSLPIDIHLHLDKISSHGLTISRYIENLIRKEIDSNQKRLQEVWTTWKCHECEKKWKTKDRSLDFVFCTCTAGMTVERNLVSQSIDSEEEEE